MAGRKYAQSFIAQGNGDFVSAQSFTVNTTNNAKQVHTLREKGSGYTLGTEETNISVEMVVSDAGPEREFYRQLKEGEAVQLRIKIPGGDVFIFDGVYTGIDLDAALDDATKLSLKFVGHMQRPQ
jgi:hypothetical protein